MLPIQLLAGVLVLAFPGPGCAQQAAAVDNGLAFAARGSVAATSGVVADAKGSATERPVPPGEVIPSGSRVTTGAGSSASVVLGSKGSARLDADTQILLPPQGENAHSLEMLKGRLFLDISADEIRKQGGGEFRLKTPVALLAVKGTRFFAFAAEGADTIVVHEGSVSVKRLEDGTATLVPAGHAVNISAGGVSSPRAMTDDQRRLSVAYDAAKLIRTPLRLLMTADSTGAPDELAWGSAPPAAGARKERQSTLTPGPLQIDSSGVLHSIWTPPPPSQRNPNFSLRASLALTRLLSEPHAEPLALLCRMRCKMLAQARFRLDEKISDKDSNSPVEATGAGFLTHPANTDEQWLECLVPVPLSNIENAARSAAVKAKRDRYVVILALEVNLVSEPQEDGNGGVGGIDLSDFVLLSTPPLDTP
jgi:hypothetical protein